MSVSSATVWTPASVPSATMVSASSRAWSTSFMKAPVPTLTSSTSAPVPSAIFLRHDRRGDQRDRLDGAGDVAQRVELLVGRGQPVAGRTDDRADRLELGEHLLVGQRRAPAGDRLELVERAAGVAEAPAGQLRDGHAAGGDQRRQRQRDLVTHPAGGVLVGGRPRQRGEVHPLARRDHGAGPARDLAPVHAVQEDRHRERRHLLVGHRAPRVGVDHPVDLAVGQLGRRPAWR